jgi:TatD DNase family protein
MDPSYSADLSAVLERAAAAGVEAILCVGYDLASSRAAVDLAARVPGLFASVGVHPNYMASAPPGWLDELGELARQPRVVAIGETGLDYYRRHTPPEVQREAFQAHMALAVSLDLPVVIHSRDAEQDVVTMLEAAPARGDTRGVWHCFSGTSATMRAAVGAGCYISLAGPLTFKNAADLRATAVQVPHDRLLVETDCPYLSPVPFRGQRNEPARVRFTAECLAELRGVSLASIGAQTTANAGRVFRWKNGAAA